VFPTVETVQIEGICRQISFRADSPDDARDIGERVADIVGLTGVMAIELFAANGRILINEIATRPHNSGHYSIEALTTSQFAQHLRAILDLPPGSVAPRVPAAVTVNVLGGEDGIDPAARLGDVTDGRVAIHLYGKPARPGRKLGHVTVTGDDVEDCAERAWRAVEILTHETRPEGLA
jgi:5-(carboxyamino)imidazole ribonucleotide synthase